MKTYYGFSREICRELKEYCQENGRCAVTMGKFDGLHLGHQSLLSKVNQWKEGPKILLSLSPKDQKKGLLSKEEREAILANAGITLLWVVPLSSDLMKMTPELFFQEILRELLHPGKIVVGEDFCFGYERKGTVAFLKECCQRENIELDVCEDLRFQGEKISSTRIRKCLEQGNMEEVTKMMGMEYSFQGNVLHGRNMGGKELKMPTLNTLIPEDKLLPPLGVYISETTILGEKMKSVSNLGRKPTVGAEKIPGLETFLLENPGDYYKQEIKVKLLHFLRPEQTFPDLKALSLQMHQDAKQAKEWWKL